MTMWAEDIAADDLQPPRIIVPNGSRSSSRRKSATGLVATPYQWTEPAKVPRRDWIWRRHLIRGFVSGTIAPGGVGKTNLKIVETLCMVTGRDLLATGHTRPAMRVWLWNLEDPRDEMVRRIQAAAKHYGLTPADIGERLFLDIGREQELVIAETTRTGAVIRAPVINDLVELLQINDVDVLIIDPFVSSHRVGESDNGAIDMIAKEWARVGSRANCAVELVHHTRKQGPNDTEVTTESARGGKALTDACRSVLAINRMTVEEGQRAGVDNPRNYFRTFVDKNNLAPPAAKSDWYRLESVDLGNGDLGSSDHVGVVVPWQWPDPTKDFTVNHLRAAQCEVAKDGPWRENVQAKDWVGIPIARALQLDSNSKNDRETIKRMLSMWMANGMFVTVTGQDDKRNKRTFVEVGKHADD